MATRRDTHEDPPGQPVYESGAGEGGNVSDEGPAAGREEARDGAEETRDATEEAVGEAIAGGQAAPGGAGAREAAQEGEGEGVGDDAAAPDLPEEPPCPECEALRREVEALQEELRSSEDRYLRLRAEFDNYRRRTQREVSEIRARASEDLVRALLPVVDNLERALRSAEGQEAEAVKALAGGVDLVYRQFMGELSKAGVAPIEAAGKPFDPAVHEAVFYEETDGVPDGHVIEELQKGYLFGEKVLRPSMVKVAKGKSGGLE